MTGFRAAPEDLATLCTGGPCLLLVGDLPADGLRLPGIGLWRASPGPEGVRLHWADARPDGAGVPLPALPAGLIGILATSEAEAAPILAAWGDLRTAPPVLHGAAGLPALLAQALVARTAETGVLAAAAARLRIEGEETREAMAALLRATGQEPAPTPMPALLAEPDPIAVAEAGPEGLVLAQRLACSLEGTAAVAVHLAAACGPLTLRLRGEESGRVRAAWAVPAGAAPSGWLTLDLPTPLGPVRETAVLEVVAEGPGALSLEAAEAPPERQAVLEAGSAAPGRALAVRLWSAGFGRRFVLSPWWLWDAQDLPPAVPVRLPAAAWAGARILAGRGAAVALGAETAQPVVALGPGTPEALIRLPALPASGFDVAEAEVTVRLGVATSIEAALWAVPAEAAFESAGDLAVPPDGARGTGWRRIDAAGGAIRLGLRLAQGLDAPPMLALLLALRDAAPANGENGPVQVEWSDLVLRRLAPGLPPAPARRPDPAPGPGFVAIVPEAAVPILEAPDPVRLMELYAYPGGGYRHLDMLVEGLRLGALAWPRIRFKFAINGDTAQIEVRARPDWPVLFERWPGARADEHGPFFLLNQGETDGRAFALMRTPRDRKLLEAILRLLPTLVATAARAATTEPAEYEDWVARARGYARALLDETQA